MNKRFVIFLQIAFIGCKFTVSPAQDYRSFSSYPDVQPDDIQLERLIGQINEEIVDLYLDKPNEKFNIHAVTREDLRSLGFLTETQITNFLSYRNDWGPFRSIYELQAIDGFDRQTIHRFLTILGDFEYPSFGNGRPKFKHYFAMGSSRLLQQKEGFKADSLENKMFLGDAYKVFYRYSLSYGNKVSGAITLEKDEGEKFSFRPANKVYFFDHISGYLCLKNIWKIKKIMIGDFRIQTGQGLVFGNSYRFGKGAEVITSVLQSGSDLRPVSSGYEVKDYSGIAVSFRSGPVNFTLFGSRVFRDATLYQNESGRQSYFKSFSKSGLHRTELEMAKKHAVAENSTGININYTTKNEKLNIGINNLLTHFSLPVGRDNRPENKYLFEGNTNINSSLYFNYYGRKTQFFSEVAFSRNWGKAIISGLIHQINASVFLSLLYRDFQPDYQSFHGNAFGESSGVSNEKGMYVGLRFSPLPGVRLSIYHDVYSFPWMKSTVDVPSNGSEWMILLQNEKYHKYYLGFRCIYNSKLTTTNQNNAPFNGQFENHRLNFHVNISLNVSSFLTINQRIQYNRTSSLSNSEQGDGWLMGSGLNFRKDRFQMSSSFCSFDAGNYENRLYYYQNTIPHGYLYPFFSHKGSCLNLSTAYQINKTLTIWTGFNQTYYSDINELGSGNDLINGSKKSYISIELTGKF